MTRINTNVPSLIAQFNLARSNNELGTRLERLSTGLRINRGADDPAGLITAERIGSDLSGVEQAIKNGERASNVIATTEAGLSEVNNLLLDMKRLLVESANTGANSAEEREANQLQLDSAIASITRISNTASFGGLNLLDGSLDYVTSGVETSEIAQAKVLGASFIGSPNLQVDVEVVASAQKGQLYLDPTQTGFDTSGPVTVESTMTLQIAGNRGVQELSFTSGQNLTQIRQAINQVTSLTGVSAEFVNGDAASGLVFNSDGFGSSSFVSVERVNQSATSPGLELLKLEDSATPPTGVPFDFATNFVSANRDTGRDVSALVNGELASGDGLEVSTNSPSLSVELILDSDFATTVDGNESSFDITGGGSLFQLGPEVTALQQANIGIQSVSASKLGAVITSGGLQFLSSLESGGPNDISSGVANNDFSTSSDIIDKAIDEVSILRGRLGAFEKNVLETNERSLEAAFENLTAARSDIVDADFAAETSKLTRAQTLQSAGTSVLALANQQSQSVLQLLG